MAVTVFDDLCLYSLLDSWPQLYTCVTNFPTAILYSTSPTYGQLVDVLQHHAQEVPEGGLASNQQLGPPPPHNYLRIFPLATPGVSP